MREKVLYGWRKEESQKGFGGAQDMGPYPVQALRPLTGLCPACPVLDMAAPARQRTRHEQSSPSIQMLATQPCVQLKGRMKPTAQGLPEGLRVAPWQWPQGWALGACSLAMACLEVLQRGRRA